MLQKRTNDYENIKKYSCSYINKKLAMGHNLINQTVNHTNNVCYKKNKLNSKLVCPGLLTWCPRTKWQISKGLA